MNSTSSDYSAVIALHGVYITQGTVLVLTNGLLFGTIARHVALRDENEYVIVAALALADAISGMGTVAAGLYRIPKLLSNTYTSPTSRRQCFFSPHSLLWLFSNPLSALLILLTSVDRLFLVIDPLRYLSLGVHYRYAMVGSAYAYSTAQMLYFGLKVWPSTALEVRARCFNEECLMPLNFAFYKSMCLWVTLVSIVLYACIIAINKRRMNKVETGQHASADKSKLRRHRKLTRTLFLSSLCDVLFYALPNGVLLLVTTYFYGSQLHKWMPPCLWIIQGFNPLLNFLIFLIKQKEIRKGIKALFTCKTMPPTLDTWKANTTVHKHRSTVRAKNGD